MAADTQQVASKAGKATKAESSPKGPEKLDLTNTSTPPASMGTMPDPDYSAFDKAADALIEKMEPSEPVEKFPWETGDKGGETKEPKDVQAGEERAAESDEAGDVEVPNAGDEDAAKRRDGWTGLDREKREEVVRAMQALGRTGLYTNEEMEAMPIDKLLARGDKARRDQEAFDRQKNDLQKWKERARAQGASTEPSDNPSGRTGEGDSEVEPEGAGRSVDDIDQMVEDGLLDRAGARAIKAKIAEAHRSAEQKDKMAVSAILETRFNAALDVLVEKFPSLKNPEKARELESFMASVDSNRSIGLGDYAEFKQFATRCAHAVLGEDIGRQARQSLIRESAQAVDNAPSPPGAPSGRKQKLTQEQIENLAMRAAEESGSMEEARAVMRRLTG